EPAARLEHADPRAADERQGYAARDRRMAQHELVDGGRGAARPDDVQLDAAWRQEAPRAEVDGLADPEFALAERQPAEVAREREERVAPRQERSDPEATVHSRDLVARRERRAVRLDVHRDEAQRLGRAGRSFDGDVEKGARHGRVVDADLDPVT